MEFGGGNSLGYPGPKPEQVMQAAVGAGGPNCNRAAGRPGVKRGNRFDSVRHSYPLLIGPHPTRFSVPRGQKFRGQKVFANHSVEHTNARRYDVRDLEAGRLYWDVLQL